MKELLDCVARSLVGDPSHVRVTECVEGQVMRLTLHVAPGDLGRVIGRGGRTAEALRALVGAVAKRKGNVCRIEIVG